MYELEEKGYLYLLFIIPVLVVVFLYIQFWKRKKQREFGDIELVKKLSPEKSIFKPILKFCFMLVAIAVSYTHLDVYKRQFLFCRCPID